MSINPLKKKKNLFPVTFFHACTGLSFPEKLLHACALQIYVKKKIPKKKRVTVVLCSDHAIKKLNTLFRSKPCPTDVLSFNYDEDDLLGEIYISLQRARIHARHYGVSYDSEIKRLFIHGMFHLLGFDHKTLPQKKRMETMESRFRSR
jgi:metalloprotein, YbeY/UPF0054 family